MLNSFKRKCTQITTGVIVKRYFHPQGSDSIEVEYVVADTRYRIMEKVAMKKLETFKAGPIPVGFTMAPILQDINEGACVKVQYNPNKPGKAYLPDNDKLYAKKIY